jgi:hypothetical protein
MSLSKLALVAMMVFVSMGFVLWPQHPADAAKFCAQLRGATSAGQPDCSFSTLDACRARQA